MDSMDFAENWNNNFPDSFPISHTLKWDYVHRWFRIHSLPKSKRYPELETEYELLLERQNKLIEDVVGGGEEVVLSLVRYPNDLSNEILDKLCRSRSFECVQSILISEIQPDSYEGETVEMLDVYAKKVIWYPNCLNDVLRLIADDEVRVMVISFKRNRVVAPYDGGIDVIMEASEVAEDFKKKYKDWLSTRPDGL